MGILGPRRPEAWFGRPAGHGKADASLDQVTTCSQSKIGLDRYLGDRGGDAGYA